MVQVSFEFETKYVLHNEIGRGGMGTVFKAVHRETSKRRAIKFFRGSLFDDIKMRQHFLQEAKILREITLQSAHPNLVKVFDCGTEDNSQYIVFEYLEGKTLREYLDEDKEMTLGEVIDLVEQICYGLSALHQRRVVHMDLKPSNIMLPKTGGLKIIDLGVSLSLEQRKRQAQGGDGIILGTPQYMSPEQCSEGAITYRSDLYALGAIFYELLVGAPPFWGAVIDVVDQHLNKMPTLPSKRGVFLPEAIEVLLFQLLAKEPEERPKSAVVLRNTLLKLKKAENMEALVGSAARNAAKEQSAIMTPKRIPKSGDANATPKVLERQEADDNSTPKVEELEKVRKKRATSRPRSGIRKRPTTGVASVSSSQHQVVEKKAPLKLVIAIMAVIIAILVAIIVFRP